MTWAFHQTHGQQPKHGWMETKLEPLTCRGAAGVAMGCRCSLRLGGGCGACTAAWPAGCGGRRDGTARRGGGLAGLQHRAIGQGNAAGRRQRDGGNAEGA